MTPNDPGALSPNILKILLAFRFWGWAGFWIQVVLGVISGIILIVFVGSRSIGGSSAGTLPGLTFAWVGLGTVGVSILWHFRYTRLANKMRSPDRPTKQQTMRQVKIGLGISLVGLLVTLLGAAAIVGSLTVKSLEAPPPGTLVTRDSSSLAVQPIDLFVVQANTNTILAHYLSVLTSLWLLNRLTERMNRE